MTEIFSESMRRNCPKTQAELTARLQNVESCINNDENLQQVNIEFCKRAFRLLADCGLTTEDTVSFLSDAEACRTYDPNLKFPYNSTEGVLRKVKHSDDIHDAKGRSAVLRRKYNVRALRRQGIFYREQLVC